MDERMDEWMDGCMMEDEWMDVADLVHTCFWT